MSATIVVLTVEGREIPVTVIRKRVKNLNLRVHEDGTVALSIPQHLPFPRAQEFLERRAGWIAERVRRNTGHGSPLSPDIGPSDLIPLWGELIPCDSAPLRRVGVGHGGGRGANSARRHTATGRATGGQAAPGQGGPVQAPATQIVLDELYRTEVLRVLPGVIERMEGRIGVHATRWSVRAMKTRWGSCTPKTGAIRINTRLAAYPSKCLEFVVAHELVHLLEPSHNARFHSLLDEFYPDNRAVARRLRQMPVLNEGDMAD